MKLLILHFIYGCGVAFFGMYVGKILERRKIISERLYDWFNNWKNELNSHRAPTKHDLEPICFQCAIATLNEMRFTIPAHCWKKGADAYDWARHFQMVYQKRHEQHEAMGLYILKYIHV